MKKLFQLLVLSALLAASGHAQLTWLLVDSTVNAYSMAGSRLKPLAYEPIANVMAVVHRAHMGYGAGSGQIWYNGSTNGGAMWTRVGELNAGLPYNSRSPICTLYNPSGSSNPGDVIFVWAASQLTGGTWGNLIFGFDQFGAGLPWAVQQGDSFSSGPIYLWSAPPCAMLLAPPKLFRLFCSQVPVNIGYFDALLFGGTYRNLVSYIGAAGIWLGDSLNALNVAYSRSLDSGNTWSTWYRPQPSWLNIAGIAGTGYDDWYDYKPDPASYDYVFDMLVDAENRVHFFGVVENTTTKQRGIAEIYEAGTGWAGKIITDSLKQNTNLTYGDIDQEGNHLNASISPDGTVMTLAWLDGPSRTDTLPDIWMSYRHISSPTWSTPQNLTQTPFFAELLLHTAPMVRANGGNSYTLFIVRNYEGGATGYPPNGTATTHIFFSSYTFNVIVGVEGPDARPVEFTLEQNYPNPFNSETRIVYRLPHSARISLKIYDLLGRAVAVLVDGWKQAGENVATLDASKLSSGVYVCRLESPTNMISRKILLMK
jgi:hypothetical protein